MMIRTATSLIIFLENRAQLLRIQGATNTGESLGETPDESPDMTQNMILGEKPGTTAGANPDTTPTARPDGIQGRAETLITESGGIGRLSVTNESA